MNVIHTGSMKMQRITISIPEHIYEELGPMIANRKASKFISSALSDKLLDLKLKPKDPVEEFIAVRERLPKISHKKIMVAISKGRI